MAMMKPGMNEKQMRAIAKSNMSKAKSDNDNDDQMPLKNPLIKPSRKGLLHKKLGVPQGKKIPKGKLNRALHSKSKMLRKEANFAKNFGK